MCASTSHHVSKRLRSTGLSVVSLQLLMALKIFVAVVKGYCEGWLLFMFKMSFNSWCFVWSFCDFGYCYLLQYIFIIFLQKVIFQCVRKVIIYHNIVSNIPTKEVFNQKYFCAIINNVNLCIKCLFFSVNIEWFSFFFQKCKIRRVL